MVVGAIFARADFRVLGSNAGVYGSQTPLARSHVYIDWLGRYTIIPKEVARDRPVTFGSWTGPNLPIVEHHQLKSDSVAIDFGCETDVCRTWKIRKGLLCKLQLANYRSGDDKTTNRSNMQKIWLTLVWAVS